MVHPKEEICDIKPNQWFIGKIIGIKERYNKYQYIDFYIKSKGLHFPKVRLSLAKSLNDDSELSFLLSKFRAKNSEELVGKEVYYKFYLKPNPNNPHIFFKLVDFKDIKTEDEFYLEDSLLELLNKGRISITQINFLLENLYFKDKQKIKQCSDKSIVKSSQMIGINRLGVISPVCELDLVNFYSNIIITNQFVPENDILKYYFKIITLLDFARQEGTLLGESILDKQNLKILSESFIGALNNSKFVFYNPELYSKIVNEGARILGKTLLWAKELGEEFEQNGDYLEIIRYHTDGIYLRVKSKNCIGKVIPRLNNNFCKRESPYYKFKYKGYSQRGLFKNVNNFVLWTEGQPIKIKGVFFKGYETLLSTFLMGWFPRDFSKYFLERDRLLEKPTKKSMEVINFLEEYKYLS